MSEYYSEYDGGRRAKRSGFAVRFVDLLMTLVSLAAALLMIVTLCVPYIAPDRFWFLPIVGLAAPAVYVMTVVLTLWWVIRWRWVRASLMLVLVFVGLFKVSLFYRPEFRRVYDEEVSDRGTIKVMSYNVRGFYGEDRQSSVPDVMELIASVNPDIVCLQEFNLPLASGDAAYTALEETYESTLSRDAAPDERSGVGQVILSKYRILHSGTILSPETVVWADVAVGEDTVRVFNCHLQSTSITADDNDYLTQRRFLSDTASEMKLRSIVERFGRTSVRRAAQVDTLTQTIAATATDRIVCGDFNDTPMSYAYNRMSRGLNDAFRRVGSGYSHTFRGFCDLLRIDYVLSSDGLEAQTYETPEVLFSDHLPVVVRLKRMD